MSDPLPKIWNTTFGDDPRNLRIFLSDFLTATIKAAGLKVRQMPFRPCVVIS